MLFVPLGSLMLIFKAKANTLEHLSFGVFALLLQKKKTTQKYPKRWAFLLSGKQ